MLKKKGVALAETGLAADPYIVMDAVFGQRGTVLQICTLFRTHCTWLQVSTTRILISGLLVAIIVAVLIARFLVISMYQPWKCVGNMVVAK